MLNELYHHGTMGQKWGIRRYQNPDGSLTEEGRKRYLKVGSKQYDKIKKLSEKNYELRKKYNDEHDRYEKSITPSKPSSQKVKETAMKIMDEVHGGVDYDVNNKKQRNDFYKNRFKEDFYDYYYDDIFGSGSNKAALQPSEYMKKQFPELAKQIKISDKQLDKALKKAYNKAKRTAMLDLKNNPDFMKSFDDFKDMWTDEEVRMIMEGVY